MAHRCIDFYTDSAAIVLIILNIHCHDFGLRRGFTFSILNTIFLFRRLGIFQAGVDNILVPFQVRSAAQANFARSRRSATLSSHTSSAAGLVSMIRALYNSALSSAPRSSLRGHRLFLTSFTSQVIPYGL